jgi:hypothetical protein
VDELRAALESPDERTRRRAARALVGAYHEQQLRLLLEKVRAGFNALDAGEIAPIDLDELIAHYGRAARKLERFCGSRGSDWERAARALARFDRPREDVDWWDAAARPE